MKARVAVSMGDPSGIGAEVTAAALAAEREAITPYVFGDEGVFSEEARKRRLRLPVVELGEPLPPEGAFVRVTSLPRSATVPGKPSRAGGLAQLAYLEAALAAVLTGACDALCTAPVSKAQVQRAEKGFVGHTEWLTARCKAKGSVMMLAAPRLRVALVTNHLQLSRVPRAITPGEVLRVLATTHTALQRDFGIARPRLALCALNPHAGEGGAFGDEERRLLGPALARAKRLGLRVTGPHPADSVYARAVAGELDAVVALYHDQGLVAAKLLDAVTGDPAVNVTLGLPIVRTSPDHGVAYDRAGRGEANPKSMAAALRLAGQLALRRRRTRPRAAEGARKASSRAVNPSPKGTRVRRRPRAPAEAARGPAGHTLNLKCMTSPSCTR